MKIKDFILPIIAIVLIIYYIFTHLTKEEVIIVKLISPDTNIQKITYKSSDVNFTASLDNKSWQILSPEVVPANKSMLDELVSSLKDTNVITELGKVDNESIYNINDDNYLIVGNGKSSKIYIGKKDPSYKMVYVKTGNDNHIKLVDASFTSNLPVSLNQIKDKTIYSFETSNLKNYTIKIDNKTYELAKTDNNTFTVNQSKLDDNKSKKLMSSISNLVANTFVDGKNALDNASKVGFIKYNTDNVSFAIDVFKLKDGDYILPLKGKSLFKIYGFAMENFIKTFDSINK
jgi:hypothetical protein